MRTLGYIGTIALAAHLSCTSIPSRTASAAFNAEKNRIERMALTSDAGSLQSQVERYNNDPDMKRKNNRMVVGKDPKLVRMIGWVGSMPAKLILINTHVGTSVGNLTAASVYLQLKTDPKLTDMTIRLNHINPWEDAVSMFTRPEIAAKYPFLMRLLNFAEDFFGEIGLAFVRGDAYGSGANVAVLYSDVPAVALHELGHAKDYANKKNKWTRSIYELATLIPGMQLWKEAYASHYAFDNLASYVSGFWGRLHQKVSLCLAFMTYVVATIGALKSLAKKIEDA